MVVDLLDQSHIGRHHGFPRALHREGFTHLHAHERLENRIWIRAFAFVAMDRGEGLGSVHVVVGRRCHVGPVRLDVGQVAEPGRVAHLLDELARAHRHVCGFGVFFGDTGREVRVFQVPA